MGLSNFISFQKGMNADLTIYVLSSLSSYQSSVLALAQFSLRGKQLFFQGCLPSFSGYDVVSLVDVFVIPH